MYTPFKRRLPSSTACARTADSRATSGETNTAAADVSAAEHGRVAEHVGDDEEAHVGAPDVDLVEVGDAAVAGGDGDVLELDVHVVLGCAHISGSSSRLFGRRVYRAYHRGACRGRSGQR